MTWKKGYDISLDQEGECSSSTQTLEVAVQATALNSDIRNLQQWVSYLLVGANPSIKIYPSFIFFGFDPSSQMGRKCCTSFIVKLNQYTERSILQPFIVPGEFTPPTLVSRKSGPDMRIKWDYIYQSLVWPQLCSRLHASSLAHSCLSLHPGFLRNSEETLLNPYKKALQQQPPKQLCRELC